MRARSAPSWARCDDAARMLSVASSAGVSRRRVVAALAAVARRPARELAVPCGDRALTTAEAWSARAIKIGAVRRAIADARRDVAADAGSPELASAAAIHALRAAFGTLFAIRATCGNHRAVTSSVAAAIVFGYLDRLGRVWNSGTLGGAMGVGRSMFSEANRTTAAMVREHIAWGDVRAAQRRARA